MKTRILWVIPALILALSACKTTDGQTPVDAEPTAASKQTLIDKCTSVDFENAETCTCIATAAELAPSADYWGMVEAAEKGESYQLDFDTLPDDSKFLEESFVCMGTSNEERMVDACVAAGEPATWCQCYVSQYNAQLDNEAFAKLSEAAINDGDEAEFMASLTPEQKAAFESATVSAESCTANDS